MYAEHVPLINEAMRGDAETFGRGVLFSILSARQPIQTIPDQLRDVDRNGGESASLALYRKWQGWEYLQANCASLHKLICGFSLTETREALETLTIVPGLGIVKSAFVLQFLGFDIGCLDTHNLKRENIPLEAFKMNGPNRGLNGFYRSQFDKYMKLAGGRARELWDTWCTQIAPMRDMTAEQISELHLAILPEETLRKLERDTIPF